MTSRSVDTAIGDRHPDKECVRQLWVEAVRDRSRAYRAEAGVPLYLTLAGPEGLDLIALADDGLLMLTENGAVKDPEEMKFVAVENSDSAVLALAKKLDGLKILDNSIENLLRGPHPMSGPDRKDRRFFRAQVVNLDFHSSLDMSISQGQLEFAQLRLVEKLLRLHANDPFIPWTLCLTFNASIDWHDSTLVQAYMAANFENNGAFASDFVDFFGEAGFRQISDSQSLELSSLAPEHKQQFLMALVPKRIARLATDTGWRATVTHNARYGGSDHRAPMVTWIISFEWDTRSSTSPSVVYAESLETILERTFCIEEDGSIS